MVLKELDAEDEEQRTRTVLKLLFIEGEEKHVVRGLMVTKVVGDLPVDVDVRSGV